MTDDPLSPDAFDLLAEPWIRVRLLDGSLEELSVREVFHRARRIERLAGETPQQDLALLRMLLAVLWRAHRLDPRLRSGDVVAAEEWWVERFIGPEGAEADAAVDAYLDGTAPRWDLLHPAVPFMQVADLQTLKGEHSGVRKLIPDAESSYFSVRAGRHLESLSCAEAARWLVHLQAWSYSGIKSGALGDPRVKGGKGYPIGTGWSGRSGGVVLHGRNLAETLLLNTPLDVLISEDMERDLPVWEREPDTPAPRGVERAVGPVDLLTWQIRRVRLFTRGGRVTGLLVANGDRIESQDQVADPMTAYRLSGPQSKAAGRDVWMPKAHNPSRTLWRGIEPLLIRVGETSAAARPPLTVTALRAMGEALADLPEDRGMLLTVELVGTSYGTQDAVVVATLREELPLRLSVLLDGEAKTAHALISAAEATMEAALEIGRFAGALQQAAGGDYVFDSRATEAVLERMNEPFKAWLAGFSPSEDLAAQRERWFEHVDRALREQARAEMAGAGPRAVIGREDAEGRLVSAASAYSSFLWRVDRALGRAPGSGLASGSADQPAAVPEAVS